MTDSQQHAEDADRRAEEAEAEASAREATLEKQTDEDVAERLRMARQELEEAECLRKEAEEKVG